MIVLSWIIVLLCMCVFCFVFVMQFFLSNTVRNVELSHLYPKVMQLSYPRHPSRVLRLSYQNVITLSTQENCRSRFSIKYRGPKYDFSNLSWFFKAIFHCTSWFIDLSSLHTKTYAIFLKGFHPLLQKYQFQWPWPNFKVTALSVG